MTVKEVYNQIRLLNIKRAKLRQKQTELKLAEKNKEPTYEIQKEIRKLQKEIKTIS